MKTAQTAVIAAILLISSLLAPAQPTYSGGNGTAANPYQIATAEQLISIGSNAALLDKHFVLLNDIDLSDYTFSQAVIAPALHTWSLMTGSTYTGTPFSGTFCGNQYTIRSLTIVQPQQAPTNLFGLFGYIAEQGQVTDVCIEDASINAFYSFFQAHAGIGPQPGSSGFLAGDNKGTISRCVAQGVYHSVCESQVGNTFGGLAGANFGLIEYSRAISVIGGQMSEAGGLAGGNSGTISNCLAHSTFLDGTSGETFGGFAGVNVMGTIQFCYSTTALNYWPSAAFFGGFIGRVGALWPFDNRSIIANCLWDITCFWEKGLGIPNSIGNIVGAPAITNVEGLERTLMQMAAIYQGYGWDFTETWAICEGTNYPRLQWQIPAADWVCPDGVGIEDLAYFAARWLMDDCGLSNDCQGADLTKDGTVNLDDFADLADLWLK